MRWRSVPPGDRLRLAIVSVGGAGLLPAAPGTFGSLVTVVAVFALDEFGWMSPLLLAAMATVASGLNIVLGAWIERFFATKDPSPVVIDEAAGQCVSLFVPVWGDGDGVQYAAAFLLFRVFDILKPWGVRRLERLPKGLGILCDDLLAGLYAALILWGGLRILT